MLLRTDKMLFYFFYNLAQKNKAIAKIAVIFTKASSKVFFCVYGIVGIYLLANKNEKITPYILIPLIVLVVNLSIRKLLKAPRPYTLLQIKPLIKQKAKYSFPSNHAASSSIISCACFYVDPILGVIMIFLAFLTGISRIVTGMHFPKDILGGWFLGFLIGFLFLL